MKPAARTTIVRERTYATLLLCVVLSVSLALSPYPYLLAVLIVLRLAASDSARLRLPYVVASLLLGFSAVAGFTISSDFGNAARVLSTCSLGALVASLNLRKHVAAFDFVTRFLLVSIGLSVVGFVYALFGGQELVRITNPDGREALLYLTTLSNSVFPTPTGALIRPSFIYDEPGAYAFVIDGVLLINFLLHDRLRRVDWALIAGGFVTFSVAHLLVCLLLLIAARKWVYAVVPLAVVALLDYALFQISDVSLLVGRFAVQDGALTGDNRSQLFSNAASLVASHPMGVGTTCGWDITVCTDRFGGFGENPLFPATYFGLLPSLGYYVVVAAAVIVGTWGFRRRLVFTALAFLALIMQRPFIFNIGYNVLILIVLCLLADRRSFLPSGRSA